MTSGYAQTNGTKPAMVRSGSPPSTGPRKRDKVMVRVPATSANLGPGFDAIGMAVDIWNEFTVERADKFSVHVEGEGKSMIPIDVSDVTAGKEPKHLVLAALK